MKQAELKQEYGEIRGHIEAVAESLDGLAKVASAIRPKNVPVIAYEAQRKLEEFMHRVGDLMAILTTVSDENMEKMADAAAARAGLKVVDGGASGG